jgi:hypothetical protein
MLGGGAIVQKLLLLYEKWYSTSNISAAGLYNVMTPTEMERH